MIQATAQRQLPHHQIKVLEREYIELGRQIMRCIYLVRTTTQLRSTLGYDAVPNIKCKYDREKPVITLSMRRGRIDGQLRFLEAQIESNDNPRSLGEKLGEDARLRYDRTYELYVEVFHKWFDSEGNYTRRPRKEKRKMFPQLLEHVTEVYSREGELRYFEEEIANHQLEAKRSLFTPSARAQDLET